ncbi:ATP-dependent helicase [Clostridiaceae bacterium M8S5]|nr:ATP-dependent helicase [Clostridiaceae bacterium M8S5]
MNIILNSNQKIAVMHKDGPMLVLAGPGSGKTLVIAHRVFNLIHKYNIKPQDILVIAFNKSAAIEMSERFSGLTNDNHNVMFGTFHAIFFRIIRSYYGISLNNIIKEDTKQQLFYSIIKKLELDFQDENEFINELMKDISCMKCELCDIHEYEPTTCSPLEFRKITMMYEEYKANNNLIDFDDMLVKCYDLLSSNNEVLKYWQDRYKYILIDEFQDINKVQYETVKLLALPKNNLFIVGDDDQSIYRFRGARPEFLLDFSKDFKDAKTIILNKNYRSTKAIVDFSKQLITNNKLRYKKNMTTDNTGGVKPQILEAEDVLEESNLIVDNIIGLINKGELLYQDIAIIYRTNLQSRSIINALLDRNIPFIVKDKVAILYDHPVARDVIAYMKLSQDIMNKKYFQRIVNKPTRYIKKTEIKAIKDSDNIWMALYRNYSDKAWITERLEDLQYHLQIIKHMSPHEMLEYIRYKIGYEKYLDEYAKFRNMKVVGLIEVLNEISQSTRQYDTLEEWLEHIEDFRQKVKQSDKKEENAVVLTTMHSSKGLEYELVWIVSVVEGLVPHKKSDIEEERRLFYVGMTRAKEYLYISHIKNRFEKEIEKSRFLKELYSYFSKDLKEGVDIYHKKLGSGRIVSISKSNIEIEFEEKGNIKLDLKFCLENNLIEGVN